METEHSSLHGKHEMLPNQALEPIAYAPAPLRGLLIAALAIK